MIRVKIQINVRMRFKVKMHKVMVR
jgi:hypothetical protein